MSEMNVEAPFINLRETVPMIVATLPLWCAIWLVGSYFAGVPEWVRFGLTGGVVTWISVSGGLVATSIARRTILGAYALLFASAFVGMTIIFTVGV
jgi:hypothetical protein